MNQTEITDQVELQKEEISNIHPSLNVEIEDQQLVRLIDQRVKADEAFYDKLKIKERRKRNEEFWLGKQLEDANIDKTWQLGYIDNIIWQDLETRCALAATRIPDITVIPPDESKELKDRAKNVEQAVDIRINSDSIRRLIKDGIRHNALFFTGTVKCRWDESIGDKGDFVFELVDPKKMSMDSKATIPHDGYTADNMELIYEWIEEPVSVVISKFPDKAKEIKEQAGIVLGTTLQMASKIKYLEVWFTWYDKEGNLVEGVCWKFNNLLLGKSKNPNYDWDKKNNFFDRPRKPYIFFSYQNLGNSAMDDTTVVEQAIPLQRNINKRGRQITEIADNAVPKKIFNGNFITKEDARRVSNDPGEHIWLDGSGANLDDVRKAFGTVISQPPSSILFDEMQASRGQIDSKFATHSITRGEIAANESGISKQVTKSGDTAMMDDLVNTMVVRVVAEMAGWCVQMMRINYEEPHQVRAMGKDSEMKSVAISSDVIDNGIDLQVKASTTSKEQRRVEAMDLAKVKSIDPLTLYEDLDVSNPKERAKRLITFMLGEVDGYQLYSSEIGVDMAQKGLGGGAGGSEMGAQQAQQDLQALLQGQPVEPQGELTPEYVQVFMEFVNSGQLDQQPPEIQQVIVEFVQKLKALVAQGGQPPVQPGPPVSPPQTPPVASPPGILPPA